MRPRNLTRERIIIALLLGIGAWHAVFGHLVPSRIAQLLRQHAGKVLTVGSVRIVFPCKIVLSDVTVIPATPGAAPVSCRHIVIVPQWVSWRTRTAWIRLLKIVDPSVSLHRTLDGKLAWPTSVPSDTQPAQPPTAGDVKPSAGAATAQPESPATPSWKVVTQTLQIVNGTLALLDEKTAQAFQGSLSELSLVGGPVAFPPGGVDRISVAIQGRIVGYQQRAASAYCSGWMNLTAKSLDVSCQLEPLPLAAFQPYYQGPLQAHVFDARLKATGRLTAKANELDGRVQLSIDNLSEGDLSFLGKTVADLKKVSESERTLTGEFQILGPMDRPADWRFQLAPGNDIVQGLLKPLFNRGVENVRIKMGKQTIEVGLTPSSEAVMSDIHEASKTVQENLKILAPPSQTHEAGASPVSGEATPNPTPTAEQSSASPMPAPASTQKPVTGEPAAVESRP